MLPSSVKRCLLVTCSYVRVLVSLKEDVTYPLCKVRRLATVKSGWKPFVLTRRVNFQFAVAAWPRTCLCIESFLIALRTVRVTVFILERNQITGDYMTAPRPDARLLWEFVNLPQHSCVRSSERRTERLWREALRTESDSWSSRNNLEPITRDATMIDVWNVLERFFRCEIHSNRESAGLSGSSMLFQQSILRIE